MAKMSETQKENLSKGKKINEEIAREYQKKSSQARKQNNIIKKLFKDASDEKLNEIIKGLDKSLQEYGLDKLADYIQRPDADVEVIMKILAFLRDSSGQKPTDKQEITNTTPQIVVANETDLKALEELKNADINKGIS